MQNLDKKIFKLKVSFSFLLRTRMKEFSPKFWMCEAGIEHGALCMLFHWARPSLNVLRQGFTKLLGKLTPYPRLALSVWPSCLSLLNNWGYRAVPPSVSFLLFCVEITSLQAEEEPRFLACWANALPLSYILTCLMNFGFFVYFIRANTFEIVAIMAWVHDIFP